MPWNKKLALALLPLALLCLLCACQQRDAEAAADLPTLRIGVDTMKPFFYLDTSGTYAGVDAEAAAEACRRAGYTPQFLDIPWNERDEYLESGKVDCLWTAFIRDGREDEYLWTESYLNSELTALVDMCCPDKSLQGFRAKVAVRAGSMAEVLFQDNTNPEAGLYTCGTFDMAKTAFIKAYAGALAGHKIVLQQIMAEAPGEYRFLSDETMPVHLAVAFAKEDTTGRCQAISQALHSMKQDGTLDALAERYGLPGSSGEGGTADAVP